MEKWLCWASMGVSGTLLLLFVLDLVMEFPFGGGIFKLIDILGALACALVLYLAWNSFQDVK